MVASITVWLVFNVRHRQMNRVRNLTVSTGLALVLFSAALILSRT
jgi:hypothetical protein